jgi:glycosyltransferase involved in cell wall biosynthesis
MIKVLHLTSSFARAGAELNLARLVSNMDKSGFQSTVVSMTRGYDRAMVQDLTKAGVIFTCLEMRAGVPKPMAVMRLMRVIRETRPHILQTWMYPADLLGLIVGKLARVPVILWYLQCTLIDMTKYRRLSGVVLRTLVPLSRISTAVLSNSQAGIRFHRELGYKPKEWIFIPNSLDLTEFKIAPAARRQLRQELRLRDEAFLIGLVARTDPMKDHPTFIRAARLIVNDVPDTNFVLVGICADVNNRGLLSIIRSEGLESRFHLMGPRSDVSTITAGFDIACSSSYGEGFSNTISEAMACGIPCVVTDVGDSASLVRDTGKVVRPKDPQAFANACRELIALSPQSRLALGMRARSRVEHLSIPSIVARYEELYKRFVTKRTFATADSAPMSNVSKHLY